MSYTTSELLRMFADEYDWVGIDSWKNFSIIAFDGKYINPSFPHTLLISVLIKPKPKTITVNGVEVPEPIRNPPEKNEIVYGCLPQFDQVVKMKFEIVDLDKSMFLENGYLHYDIESAKQHVAAINGCNVEDVQVG